MGLFEIPKPDDPAAEIQLLSCVSEDAEIRIAIDPELLRPEYVRDGCLIFNLEGYGRFRLEIAPVE